MIIVAMGRFIPIHRPLNARALGLGHLTFLHKLPHPRLYTLFEFNI
jgi:hypothetical protein